MNPNSDRPPIHVHDEDPPVFTFLVEDGYFTPFHTTSDGSVSTRIYPGGDVVVFCKHQIKDAMDTVYRNFETESVAASLPASL